MKTVLKFIRLEGSFELVTWTKGPEGLKVEIKPVTPSPEELLLIAKSKYQSLTLPNE